MEKLLSKKIRKTLNEDDKTICINDIRSSLYFISKLIYLNRFVYKTSFSEFILFYSKNTELFCENSVLLFKEYCEFDFSDKDSEKKIVQILVEFKDIVDAESLSISKLYEFLLTNKERKEMGQVYTPDEIVENMIELVLEQKKIDLDIKILDPSCGGGYFLSHLYKKIKEYISINKINYYGCVKRYILENMLYGIDVDKFSAFLTKISLTFDANIEDIRFNIFEKDFLFDFDSKCKFDIIIGNPPYIGHKKINKDYSLALKKIYSDVFYDKADVSYCFFKASKDAINENGIICFITSRYFLEAKYADKLRNYLKNNLTVLKIDDYNGKIVFKNAIISPLIILLSNKCFKNNDLDIGKYNPSKGVFDVFKFNQSNLLDSGWNLLNEKEQQLFDKIKSKCNCKIKDIAILKQGIITGYDEAFIVNEEQIEKYKLEKNLLRKWIKNSNITCDGINYGYLYVVYTNLIDYEENYPNTIAYLQKFKERLSSRRECRNGVRKWYELQWGRELGLFENSKIVFPYKAKNNTFFLDTNSYLCSADIYFMIANEDSTSYSYLKNYLNSNIFEYFFKCDTKKVGEKLYEYYPNKLENADIFVPSCKNDKILTINDKIYIEKYLEKMFNITVEEKEIIDNFIKI